MLPILSRSDRNLSAKLNTSRDSFSKCIRSSHLRPTSKTTTLLLIKQKQVLLCRELYYPTSLSLIPHVVNKVCSCLHRAYCLLGFINEYIVNVSIFLTNLESFILEKRLLKILSSQLSSVIQVRTYIIPAFLSVFLPIPLHHA